MVHDDDPDRAVRSAFALRSRLAELNAGSRLRLELRIGIDSGEAVSGAADAEQFLVTGAAVNAAARLQQAAAPNEILVGALTHRLTRAGVRYGEARGVAAKGIGRLECWPALSLDSAVPMHDRGLADFSAPLIGRERELRLLAEALERTRADRTPLLVTIFGTAGAGKSRLLAEFARGMAEQRLRTGRCLPYGQSVTFYALQLILRTECGIEIGDGAPTALKKLERAAEEVFDDRREARSVVSRIATLIGLVKASEALPDVKDTELAEELRWGVRRFLERRAARDALVLVFEDVHWAEAEMVEVIEYIAEWARAPLLIVCLARPDFRDAHPSFGANAANRSTIALVPLTPVDTRQLIGELVAPDALPKPVREEIVARTEGNPLYVEEFLRALIETGRIVERAGWLGPEDVHGLDIPPTLIGLISARLDRVPIAVKRVLQRAALVGRVFSTSALTATTGEATDSLLLRDAVRRDLIVEADERTFGEGHVYRFRHVLIRDVAYATLPKTERATMHDRYARWLEATFGDVQMEFADLIAYHAEQAFLLANDVGRADAAEQGDRALTWLLKVADRARRRADPTRAIALYERAATVSDLFRADTQRRAAAYGFAAALRVSQQPRTLDADERSDAAYAIARAGGPSEALMALTFARAERAFHDGVATWQQMFDDILDIAHATGDPELVGEALVDRAWGAYLGGDVDRFHAGLLEAHEHLRTTGAQRALARCLGLLGYACLARAEFSEAQRYRTEAYGTLTPDRPKFTQAVIGLGDAKLAFEIGDLPSAIRAAEASVAAAREVGAATYIALAQWALGEALLEANDAKGAREVLEEAVAIFEERKRRFNLPEVHARCARACVRLCDLAAARRHIAAAQRSLLPTDHESLQIVGVATAELDAADADPQGADARYRETLAVLSRTGYRYKIAATDLLYATFLLGRGRHDQARSYLDEARGIYADPLAFRRIAQIDALLARCGVGTA
jgi:tetratricopeptide (TPR) repeat protein